MSVIAFFYSLLLVFAQPTDLSALDLKYRSSQYCLFDFRAQHRIDQLLPEYVNECGEDPQFQGNIDDPELYTLAGIRYLEGKSPASLNWESQPLTKYFFGLSTLAFGNPLPAQLVLVILTLAALYALSRTLLPPLLSPLPPLLLLADPLFYNQLTHPYLDLSVTFFVLLWLLYLRRPDRTKWWVGGIILGALALSKSFSLALVAAVLGLIISPPFYLKTVLLSLVVYLAGYVMFFAADHTLFDLFVLHLNILRLYRSYVPEYPKGEIFRIIITGTWRSWWGDRGLIPSPFWSPLWGLSFLATIGTTLSSRLRAVKEIRLHLSWIYLVLAFVSLRLVFPRYLLPALPSLYLLLVVGVKNLLATIARFATVKS